MIKQKKSKKLKDSLVNDEVLSEPELTLSSGNCGRRNCLMKYVMEQIRRLRRENRYLKRLWGMSIFDSKQDFKEFFNDIW
jgi:hypothetical protein